MDKETIIKFMQENFDSLVSQRDWVMAKNKPCCRSTVVKLFGTWNNAIKEAGFIPCSPSRESEGKKEINNCLACGKLTRTTFCSISCANKYNPKRKRTTTCIDCDKLITKQRIRCVECNNKNRLIIGNRTKGEIAEKRGYGANKYSQINEHARCVYKPKGKLCERCNYPIHVEVCHIKSVRSFSDETLLSEINAPENIIILCPNCHWEFDHGLLTIGQIRESIQNSETTINSII